MKDLGKAVVVCLLFAGCADQPGNAGGAAQETDAESDEGITVKWPGGSFTMDQEDGINVRAQGVDVDVEPGERVNVRVPDVEVDVEQGERVDVRAPGVDVRAGNKSVDVEVGKKDD